MTQDDDKNNDNALWAAYLCGVKPLKRLFGEYVPPTQPPKIKFRRNYIAHVREPVQRLDLHGMNQDEALTALLQVLNMAYHNECRSVLVITGKGRGVLQKRLFDWLERPDLSKIIRDVKQADRKEGGDGAYHVYLKKKS